MISKEEVLVSLKGIIDPDLGQDIVTLGFVKEVVFSDEGLVTLDIALTTPACPVKEQFRELITAAVGALEGVTRVVVNMGSNSQQNAFFKTKETLKEVKSIIAVSSCKGGVGKSTVAVNLAYQLALSGAKVGLFDADIYGPSLPTMVGADATKLYMEGKWILPLENRGVKLMSFGYVNQDNPGPALLRGPMVSQIVNQLLTGTQWGELDYLIIDMPPGTGDIALTLTQLIPITAAVVVTTPQNLSTVDVIKGIQMFDTLKVPMITLVENMSYFVCDSCEVKHRLYGEGLSQSITDRFGIPYLFELPILKMVSQSGDSGDPHVVKFPNTDFSKAMSALSDRVVREIAKLLFTDRDPVSLTYEEGGDVIFSDPILDTEKIFLSIDLRMACRCAHCVDEWTGVRRLAKAEINEAIYPKNIQSVGNYAFGILWSDGHNSLYTFDQLKQL